ncbi:MAG: hypothetical protein M3238_04725, partial [Actinomycetota bacterium]|nr:hypothetical protein [Actinomycetota bacterium]
VEDGEAEESARELLGGVGLSSIPQAPAGAGDGDGEGELAGFTTTEEAPEEAAVSDVEEGVSAAE